MMTMTKSTGRMRRMRFLRSMGYMGTRIEWSSIKLAMTYGATYRKDTSMVIGFDSMAYVKCKMSLESTSLPCNKKKKASFME